MRRRAQERVGGGAHFHAGVVQDELLEGNELVLHGDRHAGVGKMVLAVQPSRIGLLARRSSRRASASSARASGRAIWGQRIGWERRAPWDVMEKKAKKGPWRTLPQSRQG